MQCNCNPYLFQFHRQWANKLRVRDEFPSSGAPKSERVESPKAVRVRKNGADEDIRAPICDCVWLVLLWRRRTWLRQRCPNWSLHRNRCIFDWNSPITRSLGEPESEEALPFWLLSLWPLLGLSSSSLSLSFAISFGYWVLVFVLALQTLFIFHKVSVLHSGSFVYWVYNFWVCSSLDFGLWVLEDNMTKMVRYLVVTSFVLYCISWNGTT